MDDRPKIGILPFIPAPQEIGGRRLGPPMVPFLHRMTPQTNEENPLWLIVLCDLMTNLLLFFYQIEKTCQADFLKKKRPLGEAFREKEL